jgi:hypothetical protein
MSRSGVVALVVLVALVVMWLVATVPWYSGGPVR